LPADEPVYDAEESGEELDLGETAPTLAFRGRRLTSVFRRRRFTLLLCGRRLTYPVATRSPV